MAKNTEYVFISPDPSCQIGMILEDSLLKAHGRKQLQAFEGAAHFELLKSRRKTAKINTNMYQKIPILLKECVKENGTDNLYW